MHRKANCTFAIFGVSLVANLILCVGCAPKDSHPFEIVPIAVDVEQSSYGSPFAVGIRNNSPESAKIALRYPGNVIVLNESDSVTLPNSVFGLIGYLKDGTDRAELTIFTDNTEIPEMSFSVLRINGIQGLDWTNSKGTGVVSSPEDESDGR